MNASPMKLALALLLSLAAASPPTTHAQPYPASLDVPEAEMRRALAAVVHQDGRSLKKSAGVTYYQNDLVNAINGMRATQAASNMEYVQWNYTLEAQLMAFAAQQLQSSPGWWFQNNEASGSSYYAKQGEFQEGNFNGLFLLQHEAFQPWRDLGWAPITWDVCFVPNSDPDPGQHCAADILLFRIGQAGCFNINDCPNQQSGQANYYGCQNLAQCDPSSCHIGEPPLRDASDAATDPATPDCEDMFWSIPWLLRSDLSEIATVTTGMTQPGETTGQKNSMFAFGRFRNLAEPTYPYQPYAPGGTPCAECPSGTQCYDFRYTKNRKVHAGELCRATPWPTSSPTKPPTAHPSRHPTPHPTSQTPTARPSRHPTPHPTSKSPTTHSPTDSMSRRHRRRVRIARGEVVVVVEGSFTEGRQGGRVGRPGVLGGSRMTMG